MKNNLLLQKMASGPVFLLNTYELIFIRSVPVNTFFAKRPGEPEYSIKQESDLVTETILEGNEVSESDYYQGKVPA